MFVVTLPASATTDPLSFAEKAKAAGADVLEIRGDLTPDMQTFESPLPILWSPRGSQKIFKSAYVDIELHELPLPLTPSPRERGNDSAQSPLPPVEEGAGGWRTVRSFHDYEKTPEDLQSIVDQLLATKPDILKIATMIRSYDDARRLLALHDHLPSSQKRVILGMGPKAHLVRLLSPIKNALTYTFIDNRDEAAPGQISIDVYRDMLHVREPKIFGLLGGPQIASSFSPLIHRTLCRRHAIDAVYALFPTEDLQDAWKNLTMMHAQGFSVTAPWKQDIIPLLDKLDPLALELGSVNTVLRQKDKWVGYNTDVIGLVEAYEFANRNIAIVGSGGVVPSVIAAARQAEANNIVVYARNAEAREAIADRFEIDTADIEALTTSSPDTIVWAASGDPDIELPGAPENGQAIDLRYGTLTPFMEASTERGYETHNGLPMLIHQALSQFRLFTGIEPTQQDLSMLFSLLRKG